MAIRVLKGSRLDFSPRPEDIPEVQTRIPEQRHLPRSSQSASALKTLGSTIVQTGEVLGRAGAIDQARDEKRQADAMELNLKNKLFELQYGGPGVKGFAHERGQEFLDPGNQALYHSRVKGAIREVKEEAGIFSPIVAQEFQRIASQLRFSQSVTHASQGVQERLSAEKATDLAFVDNHIRSIISSPITGQIAINPQGSQQELIRKQHLADLAGIVARTNALADRLAIPRGTGKATDTEAQQRGEVARRLMREDALTKAHAGVIARFLEEGQAEEANQYFNAFRLQIDPNKRGEIQRTILAGAIGEDARKIVALAKVEGTPKERLAMGETLSAGYPDAVAKEVRSRITNINAEQRKQEDEFDEEQAARLSKAVQDVSGKDISEVFTPAEQTYFQGKKMWREALADQAKFKQNGDLPANEFVENSLIQAQLDGKLSDIDITTLRRALGKKYQHWVTQRWLEVGDERKIKASVDKENKKARYATTKVGPAMKAGVDVLKAANLNKKETAAVRKAVADNLTLWGEAGKTDPTDSEYIRMVESAVQKVITNPGTVWDTTEMGADAALQNTPANIKNFDATIKKWASESGETEANIREGYAMIAGNPRILKNLPSIMLALKVKKKRADQAAVVTAQPKAQARASITLTVAQAKRAKTLEEAGATPTSQADLAALVDAEVAKGPVSLFDPEAALMEKVREVLGEEAAQKVEAAMPAAPAEATQLLDFEKAQSEVDREEVALEHIPTDPTVAFHSEALEAEAKAEAVKHINRGMGRALSKADLKVTQKKVDQAMKRARAKIIKREREEAAERRDQALERQQRLQTRIDLAAEERAALAEQKEGFTVDDLDKLGSRDPTPDEAPAKAEKKSPVIEKPLTVGTQSDDSEFDPVAPPKRPTEAAVAHFMPDTSKVQIPDPKAYVDKAKGPSIVKRVVADVADVFPRGELFLRRVAKVESNNGNHGNTFVDRDPTTFDEDGVIMEGGGGMGIWRMDRNTGFVETKNTTSHPGLVRAHTKIKEEFGIDWEDVTFLDLRKPLISALAIRLFLLTIEEAIPAGIQAQAQYWKDHINTPAGAGTVQDFITRARGVN